MSAKPFLLASLLLAGLATLARADDATTVVEDHSLTTAEYIQRGLPDITQPWTPDDFTAAGAILADLAKDNPDLLPRSKSPKSGPVFARMATLENFTGDRGEALPPDARNKQLTAFSKALAPIYALYNRPATDKYFQDEPLELAVTVLHLSADIKDALIAADGTPDAAAPDFAATLTQAHQSAARQIPSALKMIQFDKLYPQASRLKFAANCKDFLPRLFRACLPDARPGILTDLADMIAKEPDAAIKKALTDLQTAMKAAIPPDPQNP